MHAHTLDHPACAPSAPCTRARTAPSQVHRARADSRARTHRAQLRDAQIPGYSGTLFSWAPVRRSATPARGAHGSGAQGGGPRGSGAPYSDAGYLVYNVGDHLLFADHSAPHAPEPYPYPYPYPCPPAYSYPCPCPYPYPYP